MSSEHIPSKTEVLVIGGGPGGYASAIRAGQLGCNVALVDDAIGGTCLNVGCIPSKALISATDRVQNVTAAEEMGIYAEPYVDVEELVAWKDGIVDQLTGGVAHLCATSGVEVIDGRATFVDETTARVTNGDGAGEVSFETAVVATGSTAIELPGFDTSTDAVITSREALSPSTIPERMIVLGGGYIGMELAFVYARLGTAVTVVELLDDILPEFDPAVSRVVERRAVQHDISIRTGVRATGCAQRGGNIVVETTDGNGTTAELETDQVLVAVGRRPVTDSVELEAIGVEMTDDGFVAVDESNRTSCDHVFAVGDVSGEPMLAHKAHHEGVLVAETIAGDGGDRGLGSIPAVVFTDPEIGIVGSTPDDLRESGIEPLVGKFPFGASGRALTAGEPHGFVRVVGEPETGTVVGAQIVGPEASELVAEVALAIDHDLTLSDLATTVHTHPTLSEAVMEAAAAALDRSIHST